MDDSRNTEKFIGQVEICIHQARNIRNICIYQNQDVYIKIFFNDKPESKISTKVVNGGGQNPVFKESLRLNISSMESCLRLEVWMMSRIKNYLEDQLLGFLLLPLCDVVSKSGKAAKEFELSSSDIFHSPSGLVELSFEYDGLLTAMEMTKISSDECSEGVLVTADSCEVLEKIEFPDEAMVNEHTRMVSEYLSCPIDVDQGDSADTIKISGSEVDGDGHDGNDDDAESQINGVSAESEEKMMQEEIVDMYMKSMQEFTDALAKMNVAEGEKGKEKAARVFYGSSAFF